MRGVETSTEKASVLVDRMVQEAGSSPAEQLLFTPRSRHEVRAPLRAHVSLRGAMIPRGAMILARSRHR